MLFITIFKAQWTRTNQITSKSQILVYKLTLFCLTVDCRNESPIERLCVSVAVWLCIYVMVAKNEASRPATCCTDQWTLLILTHGQGWMDNSRSDM